MYVIRRVYKVKPGQTKKAAELIYKMGNRFTEAGQRDQVRVYWSGSTMPGRRTRSTWSGRRKRIESPYRAGNDMPSMGDLGTQLRDIVEEQYIEFYEMFTPEKA